MGACSHLLWLGLSSTLFGTYLGPAPPSQLADGQSSLPGRCKVQTVLPSTGHTALFSEQMFQHLPRCLSAACRNILVSQFLRAPSAGTPCRGQVRHTPPSVHARIDLIITSQLPYKQVLLLSPLRGKLRLEKVNHLLKALRPGFRTTSVCLQSPACSCTEPGSVYSAA